MFWACFGLPVRAESLWGSSTSSGCLQRLLEALGSRALAAQGPTQHCSIVPVPTMIILHLLHGLDASSQRKVSIVMILGPVLHKISIDFISLSLIQRKELGAGLKVMKTLHDSSLMPGACVHPQWNCRHRLHRCCTNLGLELLQIWTGTATN